MKQLLLAFVLMGTLGCKKPQPVVEKTAEATAAQPAMPAVHLDPRNAAATLNAAHSAADKLEAAEAKQNEQLELLGK